MFVSVAGGTFCDEWSGAWLVQKKCINISGRAARPRLRVGLVSELPAMVIDWPLADRSPRAGGDLLAESPGILKLHNLHKRRATELDVTD